MSARAQEAAWQRAPRNLSEEVEGRAAQCGFGEGGGPCSQAHSLQKVITSLLKVTDSREEQTSP